MHAGQHSPIIVTTARNIVPIESNRHAADATPGDPAFLAHLTHRAVEHRCIRRFEMASELQPATDLGVQREQDTAALFFDDQRARGDVPHPAGTPHAVLVGVEKFLVLPSECSLIRILVRKGRQSRSCVSLKCH